VVPRRVISSACLLLVTMVLASFWWRTGTDFPEIHNESLPMNFALVDPKPGLNDWPCWRGTGGRNLGTCDHFPVDWSTHGHEGWQATVPGSGNASPILWGQQLFVSSYEATSQRVVLNCLLRKTGRMLWQSELHRGSFLKNQEALSVASSTPACDGQNVFTVTNVSGKLWLTAVDLNGKILWQNEAGPCRTMSRTLASPVLYKSLVIIAANQSGGISYLAALHRQTGALIWRIKRPAGESVGSPTLAMLGNRPQLILAGTDSVSSYHPASGEELWKCETKAARVAESVAFDDERVYVSGAQPNELLTCIKADGSGNVTNTKVEWRLRQIGGELTSPVSLNGFVYVLSDEGRLSCVQATSGKIEWSKSLKGRFSASPLLTQNYLFCANDAGVAYSIRLGTAKPQITENTLESGIVASPICAGDSIFIRTKDRIHRITTTAPEPAPFADKSTTTKRRL
jgi:outer membrane protein assembly factor BamB